MLLLLLMFCTGHAQTANDFTAINSQGQELRYSILDTIQHSVSVKGVAGSSYSGVIVIPDTVVNEGTAWNVVAVGDSAFFNQFDVADVVIPNSVVCIGKYAFSWCWIENGLEVPSSVDSIGERAFNYINNVVYHGSADGYPWGALAVNAYSEDSLFYADSTKKVLLSSHTSLTFANLAEGIDTISRYAFYKCYGLRSITFPEGLKYISQSILPTRTDVPLDIVIPRTVTCIDYRAFRSANIRSVVINNAKCTIGIDAFGYCDNLASVDMGDSVLSIGAGAFQTCRGLTSIVIPESVTWMGDSLFCFSWNLEHVTLPSHIDSIKHSTFRGCWGLEEIVIPQPVVWVGEYAFSECSALEQMTSLAPVPPVVCDNAFLQTNTHIPLTVPCGSRKAYKDDPQWGVFRSIVEDCTDIEEAASGQLSVYPNPTTGLVQIVGLMGDGADVEIFDMTGRTAATFYKAATFDISSLPQGTYIVKVQTASSTTHHKLVKK